MGYNITICKDIVLDDTLIFSMKRSKDVGMEWFPNHVIKQEDDGSNPEGTAVIEVNLNTGKFESAIFVMGKTFAKGWGYVC